VRAQVAMFDIQSTVLHIRLFKDVCKHFGISQVDCILVLFIGLKTVKIAHLQHFNLHHKMNNILKRGYVVKPYSVRKQYRCSPKGVEVYNYFCSEMERINSLISTQDEVNKIDLI